MLTGENGILTQASNAKEKTTKAEEEEKIKMAVMGSSISDDGFVEMIDETSFKNELKNQFGNQKLDVVVNGDGSFIITVEDTQRKYYVNDDKRVINSDNIIEIGTAEELMTFRDDVNSGNSYEGKAVLLTSDITLSGEWEPIGYFDEATEDLYNVGEEGINKPFKGIFDGCDHQINNLQINSQKEAQGLFGLVIDGSVRNIVIGENSSVVGGYRTGAVVGWLFGFSGNVYNCVNYTNVNASNSSAGGIIGLLTGQHTIANCKNYGTIDSQKAAGGIIGNSNGTNAPEKYTNYSHKIINCGNYGSVTSSSDYCGGIVGFLKGDILNCCNKGEIKGDNIYIGGISGSIAGKIQNCYNICNVTGQDQIGGISGDQTIGNTINCYFLGDVSGTGEYIGNIVGWEYEKIYNCYTKDDTFTATDLGDVFKEDAENINNGYPILYWE